MVIAYLNMNIVQYQNTSPTLGISYALTDNQTFMLLVFAVSLLLVPSSALAPGLCLLIAVLYR